MKNILQMSYIAMSLSTFNLLSRIFAQNEPVSAKFMDISTFRWHCVNMADMLGRRQHFSKSLICVDLTHT